jgi:hypothetical protein
MNSRALSSSFMPLTANMVGVGALSGDNVFMEEIVRWVLGLLIDRKSGVGPNGENFSAVDEERAARYGRFQCMNLLCLLAATATERREVSYTLFLS